MILQLVDNRSHEFNPSTGYSLHINEHTLKTENMGSFSPFSAHGLAALAIQNLLGYEVNELTYKIDTHLDRLVVAEQGQQMKLHCERDMKQGLCRIFKWFNTNSNCSHFFNRKLVCHHDANYTC